MADDAERASAVNFFFIITAHKYMYITPVEFLIYQETNLKSSSDVKRADLLKSAYVLTVLNSVRYIKIWNSG